MTDEELRHLRYFRRAAKQIREASVIAEGRSISMGFDSMAPDAVPTSTLLESERFRSLALAVRLVYQSNEPANFGHICNILRRVDNDDIRQRAADLRVQYNGTLEAHSAAYKAIILGPVDYTPREMFETWLYHGVFHQDDARSADFETLMALGDKFTYTVQAIVLKLSGRTIDLDDVIADYLGEERLPRITPEA